MNKVVATQPNVFHVHVEDDQFLITCREEDTIQQVVVAIESAYGSLFKTRKPLIVDVIKDSNGYLLPQHLCVSHVLRPHDHIHVVPLKDLPVSDDIHHLNDLWNRWQIFMAQAFDNLSKNPSRCPEILQANGMKTLLCLMHSTNDPIRQHVMNTVERMAHHAPLQAADCCMVLLKYEIEKKDCLESNRDAVVSSTEKDTLLKSCLNTLEGICKAKTSVQTFLLKRDAMDLLLLLSEQRKTDNSDLKDQIQRIMVELQASFIEASSSSQAPPDSTSSLMTIPGTYLLPADAMRSHSRSNFLKLSHDMNPATMKMNELLYMLLSNNPKCVGFALSTLLHLSFEESQWKSMFPRGTTTTFCAEFMYFLRGQYTTQGLGEYLQTIPSVKLSPSNSIFTFSSIKMNAFYQILIVSVNLLHYTTSKKRDGGEAQEETMYDYIMLTNQGDVDFVLELCLQIQQPLQEEKRLQKQVIQHERVMKGEGEVALDLFDKKAVGLESLSHCNNDLLRVLRDCGVELDKQVALVRRFHCTSFPLFSTLDWLTQCSYQFLHQHLHHRMIHEAHFQTDNIKLCIQLFYYTSFEPLKVLLITHFKGCLQAQRRMEEGESKKQRGGQEHGKGVEKKKVEVDSESELMKCSKMFLNEMTDSLSTNVAWTWCVSDLVLECIYSEKMKDKFVQDGVIPMCQYVLKQLVKEDRQVDAPPNHVLLLQRNLVKVLAKIASSSQERKETVIEAIQEIAWEKIHDNTTTLYLEMIYQ